VKAVLAQGYIEAAKGLGVEQGRIIFRYVLPNVMVTVVAYTGVIFAYALLNSAALSFLGLGGEPGIPDWGVMLAEGRQAFRLAPWVAAAPGAAITLTVLLANRAADAMSKAGR
jgi:peptide/nickel transport system permease protein